MDDNDSQQAARVHRRNLRIIWYTVGVVIILVAWSILNTVTLLTWWSTNPQAQE